MPNLEMWQESVSGYVICGRLEEDDDCGDHLCVQEIGHDGACVEFRRFPIPQPMRESFIKCEPKWDFTSFVKDKVWTMHDDRLMNMWEYMVGKKIKMRNKDFRGMGGS